MKTLSIFIAGVFAVVSASAQYGRQYSNSLVTVTLNNPNERVYIDGRDYSGYNNTFQITDLRPGQHTIQVVNNNGSNRGILGGLFGGRNNGISTTFNVQEGYDTQLNVRNNGRVQVRESRSTAYRNTRRNRYDRDRDNNRDQNYNYNR